MYARTIDCVLRLTLRGAGAFVAAAVNSRMLSQAPVEVLYRALCAVCGLKLKIPPQHTLEIENTCTV
jgi:hypothetical protein